MALNKSFDVVHDAVDSHMSPVGDEKLDDEGVRGGTGQDDHDMARLGREQQLNVRTVAYQSVCAFILT